MSIREACLSPAHAKHIAENGVNGRYRRGGLTFTAGAWLAFDDETEQGKAILADPGLITRDPAAEQNGDSE